MGALLKLFREKSDSNDNRLALTNLVEQFCVFVAIIGIIGWASVKM